MYKKLGKRIRLERFKKNITQEKLAELVDVSPSYIGQIERGERNVPLDTLVKIATNLDVTIDYLIQDSFPIKDCSLKSQLEDLILKRNLKEQKLIINILNTLFDYIDKYKNDD